ncbi:thiamine phosphate synthase [Polaribacter cellanae]|uniref:Thiamine-phosphate synthase n=1 Tax=Polaribacter cellanae TaxID=2818493 RepID=A0A975H994_9FLAO|nr:thiamine phosphate synthase [Polaribacter cellanae]QTE22605.1 thiamine phosphate synthase [Polaribacter cellanae]
MTKENFPFKLYLVLSEKGCAERHFLTVAEQAILGGVDIVQLREKKASTQEFVEKAFRLQDVLAKTGTPLIINDNLEVAQKVKAYGIHVGNNDIAPSYISAVWKDCRSIGYSIEFLEQLNTKEAEVSDCLAVSPVFKTSTKKNTITEWGLQGVSEIRNLTDKPLIAIGNMNSLNVSNVIKAGADCIAVASAICLAKDPMKAAIEIRNQIEKAL